MSAIKLPVEAYKGHDGSWFVHDKHSRLCQSLTEPQAKQIALALNLHDELVAALELAKGSLVGNDFVIVAKVLSKAKP